MKRPSILKQDDLKELDELDHDGDEGWAGKTKADSLVYLSASTLSLRSWKEKKKPILRTMV